LGAWHEFQALGVEVEADHQKHLADWNGQ